MTDVRIVDPFLSKLNLFGDSAMRKASQLYGGLRRLC